jgi:hypothetical protein
MICEQSRQGDVTTNGAPRVPQKGQAQEAGCYGMRASVAEKAHS